MDNIYKQVAEETDLPIEVIKYIHNSYYSYIRTCISNTLLEDKDMEEFNLSFNIPSIGKLYFNKDKYLKIKEKIC